MKEFKDYIKRLTKKQLLYVFLWSAGLFCATFYNTFSTETGFVFGKMDELTAIDLAKQYLFPLFITLALFLLDVRHEMEICGQGLTPNFLKYCMTCLALFIFVVVLSVLFNEAWLEWIFFILSWVILSAMKSFSLIENEIAGVSIDKV